MNEKYDDIIHLPHHVSPTRPPMPMSDRAAQFAPFAALTGLGNAIRETGRLTEEKIELDEDALKHLNSKIQMLIENIDSKPEISITYFKPDEHKAGGKYVTVTGRVKKIDDCKRCILLRDGTEIFLKNVFCLREVFRHENALEGVESITEKWADHYPDATN